MCAQCCVVCVPEYVVCEHSGIVWGMYCVVGVWNVCVVYLWHMQGLVCVV